MARGDLSTLSCRLYGARRPRVHVPLPFAYQLYPLTSKEAKAALAAYSEAAEWMLQCIGPITLRAPDLCTFRDMGEFIPVVNQRQSLQSQADTTTAVDKQTDDMQTEDMHDQA